MAHSIFISYSSSDKAVADQICTALENSGTACWIAPRDIQPGADYPAAILKGIEAARAVVVLISPAAVESPHILSELGHAFSKKKPIVPFRLANTNLPPDFDYFLSLSQWLDASDGATPENLARLSTAVAQARNTASGDMGKSRGARYKIVAALGTTVLAIAAIAFWRWTSGKPWTDPKNHTETKLLTDDTVNINRKELQRPSWVNPKDGLTYVWIPPGQFSMGCSAGDSECKPDEAPIHLVKIPTGFWIGQTEVTNAAYQRVMPYTKFPPNEARLPVVNLSWVQAKSYCAAIGGRLPTEAEWEYAARGGSSGPYYGMPSEIAWYAANSGGDRHEVGAKKPNAFALYDTLGNASEWVLDRYYEHYDPESAAIGQVDEPLADNASALTRGGYWESEAANIRVSHRTPMEKNEPAPMTGVRCVSDHD